MPSRNAIRRSGVVAMTFVARFIAYLSILLYLDASGVAHALYPFPRMALNGPRRAYYCISMAAEKRRAGGSFGRVEIIL